MSQSHLKGSGSVKYVSVSFFDRKSDPFKSLTSISPEEAREVIERIKVERLDFQCVADMINMCNTDTIVRGCFGEILPQRVELWRLIPHTIWFWSSAHGYQHGMPQDWNDDGKHGSERYIEAHIWSDKVIDKYIQLYLKGMQ